MTNSIPFIPLLALGTLVFAFVNFLKFVRAADWNAAVTQTVAWVAGIVAVMLFAKTQFAAQLSVGNLSFDKMSGWTQLYFGLIAASLLSTLNEFKKAFDNSDTAATPALLPGAVPREAQVPPVVAAQVSKRSRPRRVAP